MEKRLLLIHGKAITDQGGENNVGVGQSLRKSVLDCVVRNISETKALIHIENSLAVPATSGLQISDGRSFDCEVMWRKPTALGAHFIATP